MKTLPPAMNSEHEELAVRLAEECARTLLTYYAEDQNRSFPEEISSAWSDYIDATYRFEERFPPCSYDWQSFVPEELKRQIEEARP